MAPRTPKAKGKTTRFVCDNIYFHETKKAYYVKTVIEGKRYHRKAGTSLDVAKALLRKIQDDHDRGEVGLPPRQVPTLEEWSRDYIETEERKGKRSINRDKGALRHRLLPALGHLRLTAIDDDKARDYRDKRLTETYRGLPPSHATINRELALLRRMLSYAVERKVIPRNPLLGTRLMLKEAPPRHPVLSLEDEAKLLDACPAWLRLFVRLAIASGARAGELRALRWRHIDFDAGTITIEDSKSGDGRCIPVVPEVLQELHALRQLPEAPVVTSRSGGPGSPFSISDGFRRAAINAGLTETDDEGKVKARIRPHDLRHVAASRLLATGAALPDVATWLGHKTLHISRRYAHTDPVRLKELVGRIPLATLKNSE